MKFLETVFDGLFVIETFIQSDKRGTFGKTYNSNEYEEKGLRRDFQEFFYSISGSHVIRGMHFQLPPFHHDKLVFVIRGAVDDVVLDIRRGSRTFGKCFSIRLTAENSRAIFIPRGFAHGFKGIDSENIVCYLTTSVYAKDSDSGILWSSFGYDWKCQNPVVSERDLSFVAFQHFESPF